ncbi:hypothetical protein BaRGS_00037176, partial [Batillaria attramentaria]
TVPPLPPPKPRKNVPENRHDHCLVQETAAKEEDGERETVPPLPPPKPRKNVPENRHDHCLVQETAAKEEDGER